MNTTRLMKVLLFCTSLMIISCQKDQIHMEGEGDIVTKTLTLSDFSGLDLAVAGKVVITQGDIQEVRATGHANIIDRLTTSVSGDIWNIELEKGNYQNYELTIYVTIPNLNAVYLSGSGEVNVNDFTDQSDLILDLSGSGHIDLNNFTGTENLEVDISGSGIITGHDHLPSLREVDIKITGSGEYHGFPIMSDICKINMSGSGTCQVAVRDTLEVRISGSGIVYYQGSPTIMDHTNRAGSIIDAN